MYQYIAYPFDVAKTNRILNTQFNKECGENLGKELVAVYERGQFKNGAFRGMLPLVGITTVNNMFGGYSFDVTGIKLLACTTFTQPFNILMTQRQVINTATFAEPSYRQVMANFANVPKLITLGYTAALTRNALLMMAFLPKTLGNDWMPMDAGFALGAVALSHPFEVARVLIVCKEQNRMIGSTVSTLQNLYAAEGAAGLFRGFVPRTIHAFPLLFALTTTLEYKGDESVFSGIRLNPMLGAPKVSSD